MFDLAVLLPIVAVLVGAIFPVQTAVNARLASTVGGPIVATAISFVAGLLALVVLVAITTRGSPNWAAIRATPPWLLVVGGFLGAAYLCSNVLLVPRIGSGAMLALAVSGQMLAALVIDGFGLFGLEQHPISPGRLLGSFFVAVGAIMVRFL